MKFLCVAVLALLGIGLIPSLPDTSEVDAARRIRNRGGNVTVVNNLGGASVLAVRGCGCR